MRSRSYELRMILLVSEKRAAPQFTRVSISLSGAVDQ
ncbi:hypothetical protein ThrDRAFT_00047 [Frankia casuarinae]|nr:hypothetical protein CcI6DRAFT_01764 [Frankia sp. CcI6]EYT94123.1 hypothetical protein ThrDRAFT_00047 [Frankia casuarinae]KDA44313.1 hypothetical protein BMG523Draft_00812 [Frankia sp. BMG5.23]OAA31666.1 hypothetical protein AAY23_10013 [Frankia casuarinae]